MGPQTTIEDLRALHGERFKWLVLVTVMVGMMASIMSSTIVNVAVPDMSRHFSLGQAQAQWISAGFMVATTLSLLLTPWLLSRWGMRRTYLGATLLLAAGGIIGGLSGNFALMISMRVVEGIAAGILTPIPNVVIMRAFQPGEQGRAIGVFGFGVVLAPAIGPSLGGVLVEQFGWRSIFFVVVPFCVLAWWLARRYLPPVSSFVTGARPLDGFGLAIVSLSTLVLLNGLAGLQQDTALHLALMAGGAAGLAGFVLHQLRARHPLMQLRLFAGRTFAMSGVVAFIYGIGLFASTYLMPIYLQTALSYSPSRAGFVLLPAGIALALTMPVAGRLADRGRHALQVCLGSAVLAGSLALTASVGLSTPYLLLALWVVIGRIGLGFIMPALSLGSVRGLHPLEIPQAAAMINFLRELGGAIGVSLAGILLEWRLAARGVTLFEGAAAVRVAAFNEVLLILAAICLPAVLAAAFMRPRRQP